MTPARTEYRNRINLSAMEKITTTNRNRITLSASILFILLAVLYFLPLDIPYKIAFPLTMLTIMSPWVLPWQMCLAMLFSAAGDAAGAYGNFILQTGLFAAAQLMLIVYFISRAIRERLYSSSSGYSSRNGSGQFIFLFLLTAITVAILTFATVSVSSAVQDLVTKTAVSVYAAILLTMMWTAIAQKDIMFAIAAILFVFSDFAIGWHRFLSPIAGERYLIMIPYYLAQLILFIRSSIRPQVYR